MTPWTAGRLTRCVAGTEVRRTGAWSVAAALAVLGIVLTVAKQPPYNPYSVWSSSWAAGAGWLSQVSLVLGPVAGTAAARVGGRERRSGLTELLAATARPPLQRVWTTWAAITLGLVVGMAGVGTLVAVAIAPVVSYAGGRWQAAWALVGLGIVVCSALGFAAGRLVPGRLVAPAVGIVLYVGNGIPSYIDAAWPQLTPVAHLPSFEGSQLIGWVVAAAAGWLVALSLTALLLATDPGWRRWAVAPAVVALLLAIPLSHTDGGYAATSWSQDDAAAVEPVCTTTAPVVCVEHVHAGLLPAVTPVARRVLARARAVLPVDRIAEVPFGHPVPAGTLAMAGLSGQSRFLHAGLAHPERIGPDTASALTGPQCAGGELDGDDQAPWAAADVATSLISGEAGEVPVAPGTAAALHRRLDVDPVAARAWLAAWLPAARDCDVAALDRLAHP